MIKIIKKILFLIAVLVLTLGCQRGNNLPDLPDQPVGDASYYERSITVTPTGPYSPGQSVTVTFRATDGIYAVYRYVQYAETDTVDSSDVSTGYWSNSFQKIDNSFPKSTDLYVATIPGSNYISASGSITLPTDTHGDIILGVGSWKLSDGNEWKESIVFTKHLKMVYQELCSDGIDNDGDGNTDCLDSDCPSECACEAKANELCTAMDVCGIGSCYDKPAQTGCYPCDLNKDGKVGGADFSICVSNLVSGVCKVGSNDCDTGYICEEACTNIKTGDKYGNCVPGCDSGYSVCADEHTREFCDGKKITREDCSFICNKGQCVDSPE